MFLSRHTPPSVADRAAWLSAGAVCRVKPTAYRILQANLRQVLGSDAEAPTLELSTRQAFYTLIRGTYDLYRGLQRPREEMIASVEITQEARAILRAASEQSTGKGTVMVFAHVGGFDVGGQVVASYMHGIYLLSLPNPSPAFQRANELRRSAGVEVTPISAVALRQALGHLKQGGVVATAADRPVSELEEPVPFFGRPARVPSGHVRLALKTGAQIVVLYCTLNSERGEHAYTLHVEPPLELVRTGDREEEVQLNMRRVLDLVEGAIRRWPGQWQMFVPVWPAPVEA